MTPERGPERQPGIRPGPTWWRTVDALGRRVFPLASTAVVLLVLAFPLGLPGQAELQQAFLLGAVYFWSVYRPGSMTPGATFAAGLLADLLGPEPPGVEMVTLLVLNGIASRAGVALVRRGFLVVWLAFVGLAAASSLAQWLLFCALDLRLLPLAPALFEFMLAAGFYPLFAAVLIRAHAGLAAPERA